MHSHRTITRRCCALFATGAVPVLMLAAPPLAAQGSQTFNACFVPSVGALYLIKQTGLPAACLAGSHVEITWGDGGGGSVTSVTAGDGLLGGTITGSGTLEVDFGGPGTATTVARSDHTHGRGGSGNIGVGNGALLFNTTGIQNTALGSNALRNNTTSSENTAVGAGTMDGSAGNQGASNTAVGAFTLRNTTGDHNAAVGARAMVLTTSGFENAALGSGALAANTAGAGNTAVGFEALHSNTGAFNSTALGAQALANNTAGQNTAVGAFAMHDHATGANNAAVGVGALRSLTNGVGNVAIGPFAGTNLTDGSDNVYLAALGNAADEATLRLGRLGVQQRTYLAGVRGVTTGASNAVAVMIDGDGQLGTVNSSRRFKTDIRDLGDASRTLLDLRPVTFRYRDSTAVPRPMTYGLIAEEVDEVFPELVAYGKDGLPETVRYHLLPTLLLNEVQRQEHELEALRSEVAALREAVAALARSGSDR